MPRRTAPRPTEGPAIPLSGSAFPTPLLAPLGPAARPHRRRAVAPAIAPPTTAARQESLDSDPLTYAAFWGFMLSVALGVIAMCYAVVVM